MADTKNLIFLDETESVKVEAQKLHDAGVNIIIVLSHSGIEIDQYMAANVGPYVDLIVGAHSHTFLYSGPNPPGPDSPYGPYPVVVKQESGHEIPIVQASAYAKYVGEFVVHFDDEGNLVEYNGNPVFLSADVVPDPDILAAMASWKAEVDEIAWENLGLVLVDLELGPCSRMECALANLVTDSFIRAAVKRAGADEWTNAEIAYINTGGIRTSLERGNMTFGDAATILPFQHDLILFDIRGDKLLSAIELSISETEGSGLLLHHAGMKVTVNMRNPPNERLVGVQVLCRKCKVPTYEPLDMFKDYRIITSRYIAFNTGPYRAFRDYGKNRVEAEPDIEAFAEHIRIESPIFAVNDGRWIFQ